MTVTNHIWNVESIAMRRTRPRIALVHYWYLRRRGGERVFDVLADMFPNADIFTILYAPEALSTSVKAHKKIGRAHV